MKELYLFVKQFFYSPTAVGSLVPSSRKLAQSMMQNHVTSPYPKRYLEIGGGSGALTCHLINKMRPEDKLDIVETDPNFCAILRKKFGHLENISIHQRSILDFEENNYDMLLSSLPLNAFHSSTVYKILEKYEQLVKAGGNLCYFEYIGIEKIKQRLLFGKPALDFKNTVFLKHQFATKYAKKINRIWWNFPPARVIHCQM